MTMKIKLELSQDEMLALGYAVSAGLISAKEREEPSIEKSLQSLFRKIHEANDQADLERIKVSTIKFPDRVKSQKSMIIHNRAQCRRCGQIIESHHRHDFVSCKCGAISVDGGHDYLKRSAKDFEDVIELSEQAPTSEDLDL